MPEEKRFLACRGPTRVAPKCLILIYRVHIFVEATPLQNRLGHGADTSSGAYQHGYKHDELIHMA